VSQFSSDIKGEPRLGVALGGGSARGYAHIGALSVLEKHGLTPSVLAGTSFGAVIGALYATGQTPTKMKKIAEETRRRDVIPFVTDFGLHKAALFSGEKLESYFERMLDGRSFSDLKRELVVVATDVDTGERVLLRDGSLAKALRASASMPGIFAPVEIAGRRLVDGGLGSPIPIDTLSMLGVDLAIGIGAGTTADDSAAIKNVQNILKTQWGKKLHQRLHYHGKTHAISRLGRGLAYTANTYLTKPDQDLLQVHTNPPISWLHFHRAEHAIKAGEKALEAFIPRIQQALRGLQPLAVAGD
jgi:NTE family protein